MTYRRDDEVLCCILSLAGIEISAEVIATWSDKNCEEAEVWASRNDDLKVEDPWFVKECQSPNN